MWEPDEATEQASADAIFMLITCRDWPWVDGSDLDYSVAEDSHEYARAALTAAVESGALVPRSQVEELVEAALNDLAAAYPEDVFPPPPWDGEPSRDAVAAESARHTIRVLRADLRSALAPFTREGA
jgi:hypothetical protein